MDDVVVVVVVWVIMIPPVGLSVLVVFSVVFLTAFCSCGYVLLLYSFVVLFLFFVICKIRRLKKIPSRGIPGWDELADSNIGI